MKDITDTEYEHAKRFCKDFEIKNLEEYVLYVQSDTLLLANAFDNLYSIFIYSYQDVINLYGWTMSQKLQVHNLECIKDIAQFDEDFIKDCNEEKNEGYFLEADVQYL